MVLCIMSIIQDAPELDRLSPWLKGKGVGLPESVIKESQPAPNAILPVDHCVRDMMYEDGSPAPGEAFYMTLRFQFENLKDYEDFFSHPDVDQIGNTIKKFMQDNIADTINLEFERDRNPYYIERDDAYPRTLTEGARGDIQVGIDDVIPMINETYDVKIKSGDVSKNIGRQTGCYTLDEDYYQDKLETKSFDSNEPTARVADAYSLPVLGR